MEELQDQCSYGVSIPMGWIRIGFVKTAALVKVNAGGITKGDGVGMDGGIEAQMVVHQGSSGMGRSSMTKKKRTKGGHSASINKSMYHLIKAQKHIYM